MINSKCIGFFLTFSDEEIRFLKKWLHSPIANKHKDVISFFDFLFSRKNYTQKTLEKEKIYMYIFPKEEYNDAKLRHIMSYATKTMEECLEYIQFKKNKDATLPFIKALQNKKITSNILTIIQEKNDLLLTQPIRDSAFYYQQYQLENIRFNHLSKNNRAEELNLQNVIDNLHIYTMAEVLRAACVSNSHVQIIKQQYKTDLLEPTLTIINNNPAYLEHPPIAIYYLAYHTIKENNETIFSQFLEAIYTFENCFYFNELKDIFILAINLCIKKLNHGDIYYAQKAYELYLHALHKKYLLEDGELSRYTFKNIVFIGLKKLKEYNSIESFIATYKDFLAEEYRENTTQFSLAHLYYYKNEHKKAMSILNQIEFKDIYWNLNAKFLLMQIYYENKEFIALESLFKSFKIYLNRLKNIGYQKEKYEAQINLCYNIYKLIGKPKSAIEVKYEAMKDAANDLPEKDWFLKQIQLL